MGWTKFFGGVVFPKVWRFYRCRSLSVGIEKVEEMLFVEQKVNPKHEVPLWSPKNLQEYVGHR